MIYRESAKRRFMGHSARTRPDLMVHYKFQISFMSGSIGCEQQVLIYSGKCLRPYSIWVDFEKFWGFNKGNAQICLSYTSSKKNCKRFFFHSDWFSVKNGDKTVINWISESDRARCSCVAVM